MKLSLTKYRRHMCWRVKHTQNARHVFVMILVMFIEDASWNYAGGAKKGWHLLQELAMICCKLQLECESNHFSRAWHPPSSLTWNLRVYGSPKLEEVAEIKFHSTENRPMFIKLVASTQLKNSTIVQLDLDHFLKLVHPGRKRHRTIEP